jgi:transposase InsO family protein
VFECAQQRARIVVSRPLLQVVLPVFGGPVGPRASECLDPGLLQIDETLQVVSSDLPVQVQPCACQANGAQRLAAHLCQAPEHVLDACPCFGDAMIAPLLGRRDRLVLGAFALDCCDREVMSWVATTRGIDAGLVGDLMMQAVEYRFGRHAIAPSEIEWLTDNGSCYTAAETRSFARALGLKPVTTPVSSPQSNGMAESLVKTIKRDYASLALRPDARTVMRQLAEWFDHYNTKHPHSALKYLPPRRFREKQALIY